MVSGFSLKQEFNTGWICSFNWEPHPPKPNLVTTWCPVPSSVHVLCVHCPVEPSLLLSSLKLGGLQLQQGAASAPSQTCQDTRRRLLPNVSTYMPESGITRPDQTSHQSDDQANKPKTCKCIAFHFHLQSCRFSLLAEIYFYYIHICICQKQKLSQCYKI